MGVPRCVGTKKVIFSIGDAKTMAHTSIVTLDVRDLVPRERHALIFARLDALKVGETLLLVNDHDPKPLYYQLMAERPNMFNWEPEEQGPERWAIRIEKIATN
jgi:uncharacterized protein (DUF2249 family)